MYLRTAGSDIFSCRLGVARIGMKKRKSSDLRRVGVSLLPVAALLILISFLVTGCRTLSKRDVSDPALAVARLKAGGSVSSEVDRLARPLIESGEIYGLAVGVLTPDGKTLAFGYGRTGTTGAKQQPDDKTVFQLGSVSKVFLAALLTVLVDEGVLHYEDTVRSILPPTVPVNKEFGQLTLYELATNCGGLPRQPYGSISQFRDAIAFLFTGRNLYAYINKPFLYRYLRVKHIKPKAKRTYVYSNFGYGLLAHLIEVKTGRTIQELMQEKICEPLHLRDTTFVLNAEQKKRLAMGHAGVQPFLMRRGHPMEPWDMGEMMLSSGCLYSTVSDLMIFAKASLGSLGNPLEPALASTQRAQLHRPSEDVAFGWLINYLGDDRLKITYKEGVIAGYSAYIGFNDQSGVAVVVLSDTFSWNEKIGHNLVLRLSEGLALAHVDCAQTNNSRVGKEQ
jgi:CubicO group peptidase (beta-lactamase class C family)